MFWKQKEKETKLSWSSLIREMEKWVFEQDIEGSAEMCPKEESESRGKDPEDD